MWGRGGEIEGRRYVICKKEIVTISAESLKAANHSFHTKDWLYQLSYCFLTTYIFSLSPPPLSHCMFPLINLLILLTPPPGNFRAGEENGTIMKKSDSNERNALKALMDDTLRPYVPEFKKVVEKDDDSILPILL